MLLSQSDRRDLLEGLFVEAEFRRCQRDPLYFFRNYWRIELEDGETGAALFELYDYQEEMLATMMSAPQLVVLKSRQLGATTLALAWKAWELLFTTRRVNGLVVSWSEDVAKKTMRKLVFGILNLPDWLRDRCGERTNSAVKTFAWQRWDGSQCAITVQPPTDNTGASDTWSWVLLDEYALYPSPSAVWASVEAATALAVASGRPGAVMIISTSRGLLNDHTRKFKNAWTGRNGVQGSNGWHALFYSASVSRALAPERFAADCTLSDVEKRKRFNRAWENKRDSWTEELHRFYQEWPLTPDMAFEDGGRKRFQGTPSSAHRFPFAGWLTWEKGEVRVTLADPEDVLAFDDAPVRFVADPTAGVERGFDYVLAADPSGGTGADFAVAQVLTEGPDGLTDIHAYVRRNDMDPYEFADLVNLLGRLFRGDRQRAALAVVERAASGNADGDVIARLRAVSYPNLFRYTPLDRRRSKASEVIGWPANTATRNEAIAALARRLPQPKVGEEPSPLLRNIWPEFRDELATFVVKKYRTSATGRMAERYEAEPGAHDDTVLSAGMACAVLDRLHLATPARQGGPGTVVRETVEVSANGIVLSKIGFDPDEVRREALEKADRQHRQWVADFRRQKRREDRREARAKRRRQL